MRVLGELDGVDLVTVVDADPGNLRAALRGRTDVEGFADVLGLLAGPHRPDLAVVATPTRTHAAVAAQLLEAGVSCLVEKPLAVTRSEGEHLVSLARDRGLQLAVGHVERFNPAIQQMHARLGRGEGGSVHLLTARRTGPFPARIQDVGVITDLATHDVDVMHLLTGSSVVRLHAESARRVAESHEDLFAGTLRFASGQIGLLDVNWLTPFKTRELTVVCERGTYVANYLTQELTFYENASGAGGWESLALITGVTEGDMVRYAVRRAEPLRAELEAFAAAVRSGEAGTCVSGADALATLDVVAGLVESAASARLSDRTIA
ncbi:MAG: Gfo/Idh/MocA family oxidoreductase [Actinomycetota bacterium]|nr:Gfo/Idh/MocA family oxidoreductase [Actinomycetota bacterium]